MTRSPGTSGALSALPVDLGQRPERHVVKRRDRLQSIARTNDHRRAAVPQFDRGIRRNDIAKRHGLAFSFGRRRRELHDLGDQLLMDVVHLVDLDVRDFVMLRQIEARIVASITLLSA